MILTSLSIRYTCILQRITKRGKLTPKWDCLKVSFMVGWGFWSLLYSSMLTLEICIGSAHLIKPVITSFHNNVLENCLADVSYGRINCHYYQWTTKAYRQATTSESGLTSLPPKSRGIESRIGNTALIEIKTLSAKTGCKIYAKLELNNPAGSSKDRVAFGNYKSCRIAEPIGSSWTKCNFWRYLRIHRYQFCSVG